LGASITVRDGAARPLPGAAVVVYADGAPPASTPARALMDQKNEQFVPDFLVVRAGTEVSFPNSDRVLHHVYSFSPAKVFELAVLRRLAADPFRSEGIVAVGCNIHDHDRHIWASTPRPTR
jgi:plastocyanin